jgi:hypothetical protein
MSCIRSKMLCYTVSAAKIVNPVIIVSSAIVSGRNSNLVYD